MLGVRFKVPFRVFAATLFTVTLLSAAMLNNPAPPFTLYNSHHQKRVLSTYKGKVVFINFWASWCAPCRVELPELNKLTTDYKNKGAKILAINVDTDKAAARRALGRLGQNAAALDILWDTKSAVVSRYNIDTMPSSFILDGHGIIRFTHSGFHNQDPQTWRQEIDRLLGKKS
jgi:cytochrome c biogenesis protein CcmG/thiol:disulfide interchange protein DsbE